RSRLSSPSYTEALMFMSSYSRRKFLWITTGFAAGFSLSRLAEAQQTKKEAEDKEPEVTATEDLMREHGILRRSLLVYTFAAGKLDSNPPTISPGALQKTAKLFRAFGEDYHERML